MKANLTSLASVYSVQTFKINSDSKSDGNWFHKLCILKNMQ